MLLKKTLKEHNTKWSEILERPYRILIVDDSVYGKTNALLNLIDHEADIEKIYLYPKGPYETNINF